MANSRSRQGDYVLRLYVSRSTVRSTLAVRTIRRVCKVHLQGKYALEVMDDCGSVSELDGGKERVVASNGSVCSDVGDARTVESGSDRVDGSRRSDQ